VNDYDQEFTQGWDRTLRFGLALSLPSGSRCARTASTSPAAAHCGYRAASTNTATARIGIVALM
jgi:hypothetical protein